MGIVGFYVKMVSIIKSIQKIRRTMAKVVAGGTQLLIREGNFALRELGQLQQRRTLLTEALTNNH